MTNEQRAAALAALLAAGWRLSACGAWVVDGVDSTHRYRVDTQLAWAVERVRRDAA